tara:strand:+ start:258 stop:476 length:219 start_codon:yes stop_codon:yes gene_type:complete
MSLVLENVSFSQELNDTFQQPVEELSFELRKIRNSRRRGSKAITNAKKRVRKNQANLRKARTALRSLKRRIR